MGKILLEMTNITKTFPGVKALDNVNLQVAFSSCQVGAFGQL